MPVARVLIEIPEPDAAATARLVDDYKRERNEFFLLCEPLNEACGAVSAAAGSGGSGNLNGLIRPPWRGLSVHRSRRQTRHYHRA
jgi:hypothetical protein